MWKEKKKMENEYAQKEEKIKKKQTQKEKALIFSCYRICPRIEAIPSADTEEPFFCVRKVSCMNF